MNKMSTAMQFLDLKISFSFKYLIFPSEDPINYRIFTEIPDRRYEFLRYELT